MRSQWWMSVIGIVFALGGVTGRASARPSYHHRHPHTRAVSGIRRPASQRSAGRRHAWITGDRQTHPYYLRRVSRSRPSRANRMYLRTVANARAAGYQPARQDAVPVDPRLTWHNGHSLPSLGRRHVPPPPPKWMQQPAAPPNAQQPLVTPTQPMPN